MNSGDDKQEIIIIKRPSMEADGHHGGAWKIAFADFMTAMMALFLVLWLVNAANEESKKAIASYFNPVKLVDRNRSSKGLHETQGLEGEGELAPEIQKEEAPAPTVQPSAASEQQEFFEAPIEKMNAMVDEYRASQVQQQAQAGQSGPPSQVIDPFAPEQWQQPIPETNPAADQPQSVQQLEARLKEEQAELSEETREADIATEIGSEKTAQPEDKSPSAESDEAAAAPKPEADIPQFDKEIAELYEELNTAIAERLGIDIDIAEQIVVSERENQIVISLSDNLDIPMFTIGSAVPSAELVLAVEGIAEVLSQRQGKIRIEGHTDARPFSGQSDNWQLSSQRAQSALYMLVRGGLEEGRITEVAGYADRMLADAEDPYSEKNRRIDILLELAQ